jgi:uncharacterized protein (DUF302 family)
MKRFIPILTVLTVAIFLFSCETAQQPKETQPLASDVLKGNVEPYYFATTLSGEYDTIVEKVTAALKSEGFGVITTIDVQKTFKAKLDLDYKKYLILGACNPSFAHKALEAEDKIGTMLPCNVVIQETGENTYEVAGVNPVASMMAIENADLAGIAIEVRAKMQAVIEKLE